MAVLERRSAPPPAEIGDVLTAAEPADEHLNAKRRKLEAGEPGERTFHENYQACALMVEAFGGDRRSA